MSQPFSQSRPIDELNIPFDPTQVEAKVARRRRMMRSRVTSLVITAIFLAVIYFWQRDQLSGAGFVGLYAVVLAVSVSAFVVSLVGYRRARKELTQIGTGVALRIGRPGVELRGCYVAWSEVVSLAAVKGGLGQSARLQLTRTNGEPLTVPLDQIDVRPATLDLTARAYSGGRHGVDLQALDS
jgi:hypothetical protein